MSRSVLSVAAAVVLGLSLAGCGGGSTSQPDTTSSSPPASTAATSTAPSTITAPSAPAESSGPSASSSSGPVGMDEAGEIATDKYSGTVKSVESDHYHGKDAWEVEIQNSDQGRIEVKVAKSTGKILHMEKED